MSAADLREQLLKLSEEERVELTALLIESLEGADPNDADQDSLAEARKRGEEIASREVQPLNEDECLGDIRVSWKR